MPHNARPGESGHSARPHSRSSLLVSAGRLLHVYAVRRIRRTLKRCSGASGFTTAIRLPIMTYHTQGGSLCSSRSPSSRRSPRNSTASCTPARSSGARRPRSGRPRRRSPCFKRTVDILPLSCYALCMDTQTLTAPTFDAAGLRARLRERGSTARLARRLGWSHQRLRQYATGERRPDLTAAAMLATALECTIDDLLTCQTTT